MKTTVIKRSEWWRGRGNSSYHKNISQDGHCCLGFDSLQHADGDVYNPTWMKEWKWGQPGVSFHSPAVRINDDLTITDEVRESKLIEIFAKAGRTLVFED